MHYTAGASAESSIDWLTNPDARASAHVLIARDGGITQLVPFDRRAWHAGRSRWKDRTGLNGWSFGIELDNAVIGSTPQGRIGDRIFATSGLSNFELGLGQTVEVPLQTAGCAWQTGLAPAYTWTLDYEPLSVGGRVEFVFDSRCDDTAQPQSISLEMATATPFNTIFLRAFAQPTDRSDPVAVCTDDLAFSGLRSQDIGCRVIYEARDFAALRTDVVEVHRLRRKRNPTVGARLILQRANHGPISSDTQCFRTHGRTVPGKTQRRQPMAPRPPHHHPQGLRRPETRQTGHRVRGS